VDAIDPAQVTPEQFAQLAGDASDEDVERVIREVGTERVLDRIFAGFEERFRPELAVGTTGGVQFVVEDLGAEHRYVVEIGEGRCSTRRGPLSEARATITLGVAPLVRLVTGQAEGVRLFMDGKLKASGDVIFAAGLTRFFDRPSA
jgi:putative sterol carrier protein